MSRYEPTTLGQKSYWKRELLTSQFDGRLHHASYPTALVTLCGLDVQPEQRGLNEPPDCETCRVVALEFDRIDSSCPPHWPRYVVVSPFDRTAA